MKMAFKVELEVPDPIRMNIDVLAINGTEYCAFTGLETGRCECGLWSAEGQHPSAAHFTEYVVRARTMPGSLFAVAVKQLTAAENARERREEQEDWEDWCGEFGGRGFIGDGDDWWNAEV